MDKSHTAHQAVIAYHIAAGDRSHFNSKFTDSFVTAIQFSEGQFKINMCDVFEMKHNRNEN